MRYIPTKKTIAKESLAGNYIQKQFQRLECDWMISCSTRRLLRSDLDYAGNASEVHTEGSCPTQNHLLPLHNLIWVGIPGLLLSFLPTLFQSVIPQWIMLYTYLKYTLNSMNNFLISLVISFLGSGFNFLRKSWYASIKSFQDNLDLVIKKYICAVCMINYLSLTLFKKTSVEWDE